MREKLFDSSEYTYMSSFNEKARVLLQQHEILVTKKNEKKANGNGIYDCYKNPILTAEHAPIFWRYDLNEKTNPFLMERQGVNAAFNSGALYWNGRYILAVRVE